MTMSRLDSDRSSIKTFSYKAKREKESIFSINIDDYGELEYSSAPSKTELTSTHESRIF